MKRKSLEHLEFEGFREVLSEKLSFFSVKFVENI